jgi:cytochrome c peroxidase
MEAFQLFLGRHEEINIEPGSTALNEIVFRDPFVEDGKALFDSAPSRQGTRRCAGCHSNAGANNADGTGRLFATGANFHPNMPACRVPGEVPGDGGFDHEPVETVSGREFCGTRRDFDITYRGTLAMNTPSLIEAADTGPFFHNNIVNTIEEAVEFYTTDVFNESPAGGGNAFVLNETEINQIAAMLRVLNALHNMQNGNRLDRIAQRQASVRPRIALLAVQIAISETRDAIQVLRSAPVEIYPGRDILNLLRRAHNLEQRAVDERNPSLLDTAVQLKNQARNQMIDVLQ